MTAPPVGSLSHRRKLARAKTHTDHVEALMSGWFGEGYRIFEKPNSKGRFDLLAQQLKPLPDDLPLVIGDAFQCLRNSLDHLIFALSKTNTPSMTSEDEQIPQFSIPRGAVAVERTNGAIRFLSTAARNDVCDLTPNPTRQPFDQHPLLLLNKMSNRDKHREVGISPFAESGFSSYRLIRSDGTDYFRSGSRERLEMGADPVFIAEFARSRSVDAEIGFSVQILFDEGSEVHGRGVDILLREIHDHIRDVVFQRLEPHL